MRSVDFDPVAGTATIDMVETWSTEFHQNGTDVCLGRIEAALKPYDASWIITADHGEMGLSHGGLRQKMFNAYEETIRVPLVVSNPVLFPEPRESDFGEVRHEDSGVEVKLRLEEDSPPAGPAVSV